MLATILGRERFRAGTDRYFARFDGCAATVEDFVEALQDASGLALPQFRRWYEQAGTPLLAVAEQRRDGVLELTVDQSCAPSPGQSEKQPFHIPLAFGLIAEDGREMLGAAGRANGFAVAVSTSAEVENPDGDGTLVAHLTDGRTRIELTGAPAAAQVSFLRGFSAPVRVAYPRPSGVLRHLAAADSDGLRPLGRPARP